MAKDDVSWIVIVLLVVLLVLSSYLLFSNFEKVKGFISRKGVVFLSDVVLINRSVLAELNEVFVFGSDEWIGCLDTKIINSSLVIVGVEMVEPIFSSHEQVVFRDVCGSTSGTVHNHPTGVCVPSPTDIYRWGGMDGGKNTIVHVIMCGRDDFFVFPVPRGVDTVSLDSFEWEEVMVS